MAHATQAAPARYVLAGHTAVTCTVTPEEKILESVEKDRVRRLKEEAKEDPGRDPPDARKSSGEAANWPPSTTLKKSYPPSVENAVKETESAVAAGAVRVRAQASELA
jgi:hypothetical protein